MGIVKSTFTRSRDVQMPPTLDAVTRARDNAPNGSPGLDRRGFAVLFRTTAAAGGASGPKNKRNLDTISASYRVCRTP